MFERALTMLLRRLSNEEDGFTLIEALAALTILAVAGFAVAQAMIFGLSATGLSRERLAARAAAEQQMEFARSLNYDSLVLDDASALTHDSDPTQPDFWVNATNQTWDPDGSSSLSPESLIRSPGASPALHHLQTPVQQGNTNYSIYMYVTWVDSTVDGTGVADNLDGNADGIPDAGGHDQKRVAVVVQWRDPVRGTNVSESVSSIFSDGTIPYHGPSTTNQPPSVPCPTALYNGLTLTFTVAATDPDGSVVRIDWNFGDGNTIADGTSTATRMHTYTAAGSYTVVNTVWDNASSSASNANCVFNPSAASNGTGGPDGTIAIVGTTVGGVKYTTQTQVTLALSSPATPAPACFQLSNDGGSTWGAKQTYATSTLYTLSSGDGPKVVNVRYWDSCGPGGNYGTSANDSITLDSTAPNAPTNLTATSSISGANKTVTLSWSAASPQSSDFAGYRLYHRPTTSTTWTQMTCGSGTTCSETVKKQDDYEYYVVAIDNAGNLSAQSNHVTK
jgi:prepilin-type N-terminal cleavage/methylation domain-containing protein